MEEREIYASADPRSLALSLSPCENAASVCSVFKVVALVPIEFDTGEGGEGGGER